MAGKNRFYTNPVRAKRRLRWLLLGFIIALALPVFLLLQRVYAQLDNEAYYALRSQAEILVQRVEQQLLTQLDAEQHRPIAEYSFFNVLENPLLQTATVNFSPLSKLPPKTNIAGLIGYFQIGSDGSLHTPVLPDIDKYQQVRLSGQELQKRMALRDQLRELLGIDEKQKTRRKEERKTEERQQLSEQSSAPGGQRGNVEPGDILQSAIARSGSRNDKTAAKADIAGNERQKRTTMSKERLRELKIDTGRWTKKLDTGEAQQYRQRKAGLPAQYRSRKETVKLPGQELLGSLLGRSPASMASKPMRQGAANEDAASEPSPATQQMDSANSNGNVFRFESEVGPLQMLLLDSGKLCFYRRVWHSDTQYVQGFVIDADNFLAAAVEPLLYSYRQEQFSSLLFASNGRLLRQFKITEPRQETLIYRTSLLPPLQAMEMIVNSAPVSAGPGAVVVDMLAVSLLVVLFFGILLLYRLAAGQIELAGQQRNFISAVSHELKTPLTSIRMYGEMLRSGWVSDAGKKHRYYDYIFLESERLSRLIANVLQLAKLDNHRQQPDLVSHDARQLLQQIKEKVAVQCEAAGFRLNVIAPDGNIQDAKVLVDTDAFFQIMINLIDNAIKFSSRNDPKTIDIGLNIAAHSREVLFTVRDYGPGIDRKQMKKIFRLFYRAGDELTRTSPGTGIGLALVVQLADNMHAAIDVINRQPGAEFQMKLKMHPMQ